MLYSFGCALLEKTWKSIEIPRQREWLYIIFKWGGSSVLKIAKQKYARSKSWKLMIGKECIILHPTPPPVRKHFGTCCFRGGVGWTCKLFWSLEKLMDDRCDHCQLRVFNGVLTCNLWECSMETWISDCVCDMVLRDTLGGWVSYFPIRNSLQIKIWFLSRDVHLVIFPHFSVFKCNQYYNNLPKLLLPRIQQFHTYLKHSVFNFNILGGLIKILIYIQ